jgi:queuine tRNA-ribosyltransferase
MTKEISERIERAMQFGEKPIFMPDATRGAVRYVTTGQLNEIGVEGVVINTLHLLITIGPDRIQRLGGMHKFMNWDKYILSDSGGFQVFSLLHSKKWQGKIHENGATFKAPIDGKIYELTPETSIDIQMALDSDVLVTLDDCRDANIDRSEAEISVERTIRWAERAKNHFEKVYGGTAKTGKLLSCVVQGANFIDLRAKCAVELSKFEFDGYNFGGYVIDEDGKLVVEEMKTVLENTPQDKFKYAMGVGKPVDIIAGLKIGYKVFDTVLVTRNARHGTIYSYDVPEEDGFAIRIKNAKFAEDMTLLDSTCDCAACRNHTKAYFHNLIKSDEAAALSLLSIHNLRFYMRLMKKVSDN